MAEPSKPVTPTKPPADTSREAGPDRHTRPPEPNPPEVTKNATAAQSPKSVRDDSVEPRQRLKKAAGPQFRLEVPHYLDVGGAQQYLGAGTIIGDGTEYPYDGPISMGMTGVNEAGEAEVEKARKERFDPVDRLPTKVTVPQRAGQLATPEEPSKNESPSDE